MNRMLKIAADLGQLYAERSGASIHKGHIEADLAGRVLFLTPPEGWPGKNAEQRDQARELCVRDDPVCTELREALREIENDLADNTADIDALEAERRALEWSIRGGMVAALQVKGISPSGNGNNRMETAFEDIPDDVLFGFDSWQGGEDQHALTEPDPAEDFPF